MKIKLFSLLSTLLISAILLSFVPVNATSAQNNFLGKWGMEIEGGGIAWLHVQNSKGYLDGELLWIAGSVLPISHIYLANDNTLVVTRTDKQVHHKGDKEKNVHLYVHRPYVLPKQAMVLQVL